MAPPPVCASTARFVDGKLSAELLDGVEIMQRFEALLDGNYLIAFANGAFDCGVALQANTRLVAKIFKAIRERRTHDILLAQSLDAIYRGHLGMNEDGSPMRNLSTGKVTDRHSLELVHYQLTGKADAKENDVWRLSYGLLAGIPKVRWPPEASQYPIDDAVHTFEDAAIQIVGRQNHAWVDIPALPGGAPMRACAHCGVGAGYQMSKVCASAPPELLQNQQNLTAQSEFDFAAKLGAAWAFRTDPKKIDKLTIEVEEKHRVSVERFQKKGWIREDETENQAAVKRAIALAYGASGACKKCHGGVKCRHCAGSGADGSGGTCAKCDGMGTHIGRVQKWDEVDCRGEKLRGRFQGCVGNICLTCRGTRKVLRLGSVVTCKNEFSEEDESVILVAGCDGTGLDLTTAPLLPRTDKQGVSTERDTAMESGDEDVSDYGENEFEKSRSTYLPFLRTGIHAPVYIGVNPLVATGRFSYEGSPVHQFPRDGGERECIRARGAWCGFPYETILGSTDYSAGELCTLSQYTYWLFRYSRMMEAINNSGDPGILHSELAAEVMGLSIQEFLARLKAKDKQCVDTRQASKPMNFGKPANMSAAKIVYTNRKKVGWLYHLRERPGARPQR